MGGKRSARGGSEEGGAAVGEMLGSSGEVNERMRNGNSDEGMGMWKIYIGNGNQLHSDKAIIYK